jgi:PAS domain S-box-containing protein
LQTINAELNTRNDTLVRANSDLANLLDSTSIATLFLDSELRIRRFTPPLLEIFKFREGDEGRPIGDIVTRLGRDGLGQDVQQVLRTLVPIERERTVAENGVSYLVRIRPYRDLNNVIDGAVITFTDISERKQHERARALLAAIVESSQDAIISHDLDGIITSWNAGAEQLYEHPASEAIGQSISMLLAEALPDDWARMREKLEQGEQIARFESASVVPNGHSIALSVTISPIRDGDGRVAGASVVARNISARRAAEQKTSLLLGELDHRVKNILAIVSAVVSQTVKTSTTPEAFAAEIEGRVQSIAKAHTLLSQAGQGEMALARPDHDGIGALRPARGQPGHRRPRRRADGEGRAGARDGDPRARQQCGQVWRALGGLRSARSPVDGYQRHAKRNPGACLDRERWPCGAATGTARVRNDVDRARLDPRTRCRGSPGIRGIRPALYDRDSADGRGRAGTTRTLQPRSA